MNVIFLYAQIKDKLSKEDAFELCRLYMSGLTYIESMNKLKEIEFKTFSKDRGKGNYYGREKNALKNNFGFR